MALIDTNILLRFLLQDHDISSQQAKQIIDDNDVIESENKSVILKSLSIFKETSMDCLLIAYRIIDNSVIFSFDKKVNNYLNRISF